LYGNNCNSNFGKFPERLIFSVMRRTRAVTWNYFGKYPGNLTDLMFSGKVPNKYIYLEAEEQKDVRLNNWVSKNLKSNFD